ncbi:MAG: hypothetical protein K2X39_02970, partial [Silvanigrellaceae bacterium]|nr:hypothetical protein [Silvanigrellaceae bacterium]
LAKEYIEEEGSTPIYSSWGIGLAREELNKARHHIPSQQLDSNNELKQALKTLESKMEELKNSAKEEGGGDYRLNFDKTFNERVKGNVGMILGNAKNLPKDLEVIKEMNKYDLEVIKMGIRSKITANAEVGSSEDRLFNRDYADLDKQEVIKTEKENFEQPNVLAKLGLFSPRDKPINIRLFLIKADRYYDDLKEEDNKHIVKMREELRKLLDECPENAGETTKAQRDAIRNQIEAIDEVKLEIYRPG